MSSHHRMALICSALLLTYWLLSVAQVMSSALAAEPTELVELLLRLLLIGTVCWGLWQRQRWAWWLALLLGIIWSLAASVGIAVLLFAGALAQLPTGYLLFYGGMATTVLLLTLLLLMPAGRQIVAVSSDPAATDESNSP